MKILSTTNSKTKKKLLLTGASLCSCLLACNSFGQTTAWWDNNGASAATSGNWDTTSTNWSLSSSLSASTVPFTNGEYAIFAAGSGGILNLAITVPGAVSCEGLGDATTSAGVASGAAITNLSFSGAGSINLPSGVWPFECGNSSPAPTITINVPITGPGGFAQHNVGALQLYATNTYSGGTEITGGQLTYYNNNASFGTGPIIYTGTQSILNTAAGVVTLTNAWAINNAGGIVNFATGNTVCSGPWSLQTTPQIKDNSATLPLTISGPISGAFGLDFQNDNSTAVGSGTITLSGANTYTGQTFIGLGAVGGITTLSVSSINSVTTPPQQPSSSLGVPSSAATGTITIGATTFGCALIYTGPGETSDRVISLTGTTGAATIQMNGTGPLVLTSSFTVPTNGARTLTLSGTSTTTNTIGGAIPNSGSGAIALTKAQAGTWVLAGTNTFSGATTISAGTLIIGGAGKLNNGSYAGNIANSGTFIYGSTASQTLSGVISGAGTLTQSNSGTLVLSGANTYTGITTLNGGTVEVNKAEVAGTSGPLGKSAASNPGSIVFGGGTLQYASANAGNDYSGRFSTVANEPYSIDVNGQSVTFGTALSSSGGTLTVKSTAAGGVLTLNAPETYTGATTISSGTLTIGTSGSLDGGNYAANITDNGTFNYAGTGSQTISGMISGTGGLTVGGTGTLSLTAAPTYNGATVIAAGGTLDVSALGTPYSLTGSSLGATSTTGTSAIINGAASGTLNLGAQPISLTMGDSTVPVLNILQASLQLSGNLISLSNASGTPLGTGNYTLIQVGGGVTTGTPNQYVAVTGAGIAAGDYATVQVVGGNVVLVVTQPANSGPTWNGNDYSNFQTWSDSANWVSGAPDAIGDLVFFFNTGGPQTPVMDSSYTVNGLTFENGCSSDILTASSTNKLTVGSGVTNASGTLQTIAMPVQLVDLGGPSVPSQWSTSGGNITVSSVISDNNIGLAASGGNTLTLGGLNTYTGGTTINGATVSGNSVADAPCSIGTGALIIEGGGSFAFTGVSGATARTVSVEGSTTDTINVPGGSSLSLNGQVHAVSDTAAQMLALTGGGTLNLGGTVDNSGLTMAINQGEVVITKTSASTVHGLGGGTTTVGTGAGGNSAELQLAGNGGFDLFSTCVVTINSPDGFMDLNGQNDSFSTLTLSGAGPSGNGALINSATGTTSSITNGGSGVVLAGATTIGGPGNIKLASVVGGSGMSVTYAGTGTLTMAGANTYSGGSTVNSGGTLQTTAGGTTTGGAGTGTITLLGTSTLIVNMGNSALPNAVTGGSSNTIDLILSAGNLWLSNTPSSQLSGFGGTFNVSGTVTNGGQLVVGNGAAEVETINAGSTWQINAGTVVDFNVGQTDPATVYLYGFPYFGAADGALRLDASVQSGPVILMGNSEIGNGNAGVSTISGAISGSFGFVKTSGGAGGGPLVLAGTNTYTGFTTISNGSLTIGDPGSLGSGSYAANITNLGTFIYNSSVAQTLAGVISGSGALTQEGPGSLTLTAADTYTGATTISADVLSLSGVGAISNSSSITIAAGGTFDVSQLTASTFFLSASTALNASGIGTGPTAATLNSATTVNLGSRPIGLTYTPASFTGDLADPALYVSHGALALNGNAITVNNAGGSPLGNGTYTLISVAGGSITGVAPTATVTGSGLAANSAASIQINGGSLNLVVGPPPTPGIATSSISGGNFVFSGTNGPANGTYTVLTSTNAAQPLASWTPIATNKFSATGTFSVTNAVGTNLSQFFIIVVP